MGYGEIQRDIARYSWIQVDTVGYSGIQWDIVGYSGSAAKWLDMARYRDTRDMQAGYREIQAEYASKGRAQLGLCRILPTPILYGVWHTKGGLRRDRILRSSRAILLQQCGHYRWGGQ